MSLMNKLMKQWHKPTGWIGELIAREMNLGHARLTAWGLQSVIIAKEDVILDVGCGGGRTVNRLAGVAMQGKVYGVDVSESSLAVSRKVNKQLIQDGRVEIRQASVSGLPFPDEMFDLATAIETLYFWPDLIVGMREILRVLKAGGNLVIIAEAYRGGKYDERIAGMKELENFAVLSVEEMHALFAAAGYAEVKIIEEYERGWICGTGLKPASKVYIR